jgi:hypothetical protein
LRFADLVRSSDTVGIIVAELTEHQFCGFHACLEKFVFPVTRQVSSDGLHLLLENLYAEGIAVET